MTTTTTNFDFAGPSFNIFAPPEKLVWTIEKLIDEVENYVVRIKEEEEGKQHKSSRKYLQRAVEVITNWTRINDSNGPHFFVFDIADFAKDAMIAAELYNLSKIDPSALAYVLNEIVKRLFSMVSSRWFYESASKEIQVVLS